MGGLDLVHAPISPPRPSPLFPPNNPPRRGLCSPRTCLRKSAPGGIRFHPHKGPTITSWLGAREGERGVGNIFRTHAGSTRLFHLSYRFLPNPKKAWFRTKLGSDALQWALYPKNTFLPCSLNAFPSMLID